MCIYPEKTSNGTIEVTVADIVVSIGGVLV